MKRSEESCETNNKRNAQGTRERKALKSRRRSVPRDLVRLHSLANICSDPGLEGEEASERRVRARWGRQRSDKEGYPKRRRRNDSLSAV